MILLLLECEVWEAVSGADIIWRGQFMKNFLRSDIKPHFITPKVAKQAQKSTSSFFGLANVGAEVSRWLWNSWPA